eukprot:TRINITY_DN10909_c0_g2_i1.p1 TRINITY_DN10909_c0_g2~~TRINITY_DN10909_c0_g2_i1.p1  ORF type:complete len:192 (+),score=21.16 TRINITY_DN10909_c0_g2_i1:31-606(+)
MCIRDRVSTQSTGKTFLFELFPGCSLTLALFTNVENAKEVLQKLLSNELQISCINPALIAGELQILTAANRALYNQSVGKLQSKNLHTELIYNLSGDKNLAQSLKTFGMSPDSSTVLVGIFNKTLEQCQNLTHLIKGQETDIDTAFSSQVHLAKELVTKKYSITEEELTSGDLETAIVNRISVRGTGVSIV